MFDALRAAADGYGYTLPPGQLGWALPVCVGDTDEAAEAIALPALDMLFNKLIRMPKELFFPAGYTSPASAARIMASKGGLGSGDANVRELVERGYAVIGSPDTVRCKLDSIRRNSASACCARCSSLAASTTRTSPQASRFSPSR